MKSWKDNKVFQADPNIQEEEEIAKRGPSNNRKENYTILNNEMEEIYEKLKVKIKFPYPGAKWKNSEKESGKYYKNHKDYCYLTDHCRELNTFVESLVKESKLKEYIQKDT